MLGTTGIHFGSLTFILYINDILMALHNLNINLIFFADDTSVSISEPSNNTLKFNIILNKLIIKLLIRLYVKV